MGFISKISKGFADVVAPIGGLLNGLTGVTEQTDRTYNQQKAMMQLQNEYNSPAAQLARMREAGIDINPTAYALGTGNLSNTSASGFSGNGSPAGNPITSLLGVASGIQGIKESKARTDNMEKQNQNLTEVIESTRLENQIRNHNLQYAQNHGVPVGSMPGMDATLAGVANEGMEIGKEIYRIWQKHRDAYKKEHPEYNGW